MQAKDREIADLKDRLAKILALASGLDTGISVRPVPPEPLEPSEAILFNLEGNDTAKALLVRWAGGDVSAGRELSTFLRSINHEQEANVIMGRVDGLEPQYMTCGGMIKEANMYVTSPKPQEKRMGRDKLVKLFGRF
ncbi:hypothetical protein AYO40_01130 [Planctomycetaceae bacterium SCGC AG-212-D15]|nr:hypothetical protein AYO40_01130 [Planctomycetaceae bacterium SCGC AG-212-D15]